MASASAIDPQDEVAASGVDSATAVAALLPNMAVEKVDVEPATPVVAGDIIDYTITIENNGNVIVSVINVTDPNADAGSISCVPTAPFELAVGATASCVAQHTITQEELNAGFVENTATATGSDPQFNPVMDESDDPDDPTNVDPDVDGDPDDPTLTLLTQSATMSLVKTASTPTTTNGIDIGATDAGDMIDYTYLVTNTGNVTLANISITDPGPTFNGNAGSGTLDAINCTPTTLDPGEVATCTATYTLSQADVDNAAGITDGVSNTANASGDDPLGANVDSPDDTATTSIANDPELSMIKSAGTPTVVNGVDTGATDAGDTISYTYEVTNTGNVTMDNIVITDPGPTFNGAVGTGTLSAITCAPATLAPGAISTCSATYTLSQADVDNAAGITDGVSNTANASGDDPSGTNVDSPDDTATTTIANEPELSMVKSAGAPTTANGVDTSATDAGDTIAYTYEVTNTGNVTLANISITDPGPTFNGAAGTGTLSVITCAPTTLAPGAISTCSATYTLSQADVDNAAGITDGVSNTATASGADPTGTNVDSPDDTATTTIVSDSELSLVKSAGAPTIANGADTSATDAGDTISYTYEVTNTGNVTMDNIVITDPGPTFNGAVGTGTLSAITCAPATLAPGAISTCSATYTLSQADVDNAAGITDGVSNTANASGDDPSGTNVDSPDDTATTTIANEPELTATKGSDATGLSVPTEVGDEIVYTIIVENTGNVTVSNMTVTDAVLGGDITSSCVFPVDAATGLAPGEIATCTVNYALTQTDINVGAVQNTAVGAGEDPAGGPVTDDSDSINPGDDTGADDDPTNTPIPQSPQLATTKGSNASGLSVPTAVGRSDYLYHRG